MRLLLLLIVAVAGDFRFEGDVNVTDDEVVGGVVTTPTINHASGVSLQYNGVTQLTTQSGSVTITNDLNVGGEASANTFVATTSATTPLLDTDTITLGSATLATTASAVVLSLPTSNQRVFQIISDYSTSTTILFYLYTQVGGTDLLKFRIMADGDIRSAGALLTGGGLDTTNPLNAIVSKSSLNADLVFVVHLTEVGSWRSGSFHLRCDGMTTDFSSLFGYEAVYQYRFYNSGTLTATIIGSARSTGTVPTVTVTGSTAPSGYNSITITVAHAISHKSGTVSLSYYEGIVEVP